MVHQRNRAVSTCESQAAARLPINIKCHQKNSGAWCPCFMVYSRSCTVYKVKVLIKSTFLSNKFICHGEQLFLFGFGFFTVLIMYQ